jgi:CBS domain-containing protein
MKARDFMTTDVLTVRPETTVKELASLFIDRQVSGAPVVDKDGKLVGIITEADLIEQNKNLHIPTVITLFEAVIYLENPRHMEDEIKEMMASTVADLAKKDVVTATEETDIHEVASLMSEKHVHLIPVVRGETVVGIIGKADMVRALMRMGESTLS